MAEFIIRRSKDGRYFFSLQAASKETILSSDFYNVKQGARNGIQLVRIHALNDSQFERIVSRGQYYFVLHSRNGEPLGTSIHYSIMRAREDGIESVKLTAPTAEVVDLSN